MTLKTQRPAIGRSLGAIFGTKGATPQLAIEDNVLTTAELSTLLSLPYSQIAIPVARHIDGAAVAGQNTHAWARPGPSAPSPTPGIAVPSTTLLRIRRIGVRTAVASTFFVTLMTNAQRAAFGGGGPLRMVRTRPIAQGTDGLGVVELASHEVNQATNAAVIGTSIGVVQCGAATQTEWFDCDAVLIGGPADNLGVWASPAIAIVCGTVNQAFSATFLGEEWPLQDIGV